MSDRNDRYQHQPWYGRLWRRRWYLLVPWTAWTLRKVDGGGMAWGLAIGMAQCRMRWWYTFDEAFPDFNRGDGVE